MRLEDDGIFIVEDEDISGILCYFAKDGVPFEDGFRFEMELQEMVFFPGSIHIVQFPEDLLLQDEDEDTDEETRQEIRTQNEQWEQEIRQAIYNAIGYVEETSS
ncbi:hypothetical protein [Paenibacillus wenxiniae]|uniref:Uncharacterized protein n=1 Tax=Paenibacillus wenxiniae TaxID=1636843 RepID=A0ABW4RJ84_9BACL